MQINNLIDHCRYYKGEDNNPFDGKDPNKAMFWFYEKYWVDAKNQSTKNNEAGRYKKNLISEYLTEYNNNGLANFSFNDNTPVTLKALLFNRYSHFSMCDAEGFKKFYLKEYLGEK